MYLCAYLCVCVISFQFYLSHSMPWQPLLTGLLYAAVAAVRRLPELVLGLVTAE